ncbi:1,4-dihydroxy-2-naphthoate octaprenyltransferase [Afifella sp. H1R]|uniref:1,4-dihydroxy-2-naphthoate octaprenyltransferase n=1 Tax=unclassified Afifella TaxID=2624128 RepID=UPI001F3B217E|nr:1,4-dihydroxy-2-naphthoate octaprenyltransferase [Afifella sp. H1R]MCF1503357.1 1,4-dihydroxy-2-naphthoate octaprenyltransferase [Afifella sp. H1R]
MMVMVDAMTPEKPSPFAIWWYAIRPRTLALSVSPVVAGLTLAWAENGDFHVLLALVTLISAVAIQIGTNLNNDAVDALNGTDDSGRIGPPRVTQKGWATAREVFHATHLAFFIAALGGLYLIQAGGIPILIVGILSLIAGYAYSSGPWPISRSPWGEAFVITFFGLVAVDGTFYLQTGFIDFPAILLGLAIGLPAAAVLLVNNTRDRETDTLAGRQTLAIRVGPLGAGRLYGRLLAASFVMITLLALVGEHLTGALLGLVCIPLAWKAHVAFRNATTPADFNGCLGQTASVQAALCLTVSLGLIFTAA